MWSFLRIYNVKKTSSPSHTYTHTHTHTRQTDSLMNWALKINYSATAAAPAAATTTTTYFIPYFTNHRTICIHILTLTLIRPFFLLLLTSLLSILARHPVFSSMLWPVKLCIRPVEYCHAQVWLIRRILGLDDSIYWILYTQIGTTVNTTLSLIRPLQSSQLYNSRITATDFITVSMSLQTHKWSLLMAA
jgi:hypothetical protein